MYTDGEIEDSMFLYQQDKECRRPHMYFLPKIHKGITPLPGRPIISANVFPTEKITKFIDHFLNTLSILNKSYVKDTTHFLTLINDAATSSHLTQRHFTPTSPTLRGSKLPRRPWENSDQTLIFSVSLIKLLECILTKNNFQFDNQHYLQIKGCAMGTRVAHRCANTYMGKFEDNHIYTYHLQPFMYLRYLGDIFLIWQHRL